MFFNSTKVFSHPSKSLLSGVTVWYCRRINSSSEDCRLCLKTLVKKCCEALIELQQTKMKRCSMYNTSSCVTTNRVTWKSGFGSLPDFTVSSTKFCAYGVMVGPIKMSVKESFTTTKTFWTISCFQLCRISLETASSTWMNTSAQSNVHQ